ncbi:MAG TPA: cytochrome C oxidase subunit IV family protein [Candidatus Limnocylindria bacterium]|nr:cytochrome C oxidase subunit IV family protein [Candidatus Limnocylindria bacterium]
MSRRGEKRLTVVWLALAAITLAQLAVGSLGDAQPPAPNAALTTSAIVIALVKVRVIIREFMEVRHAPALLCRLTDLWVVVTGVSLLGAYFVGMALAAR